MLRRLTLSDASSENSLTTTLLLLIWRHRHYAIYFSASCLQAPMITSSFDCSTVVRTRFVNVSCTVHQTLSPGEDVVVEQYTVGPLIIESASVRKRLSTGALERLTTIRLWSKCGIERMLEIW